MVNKNTSKSQCTGPNSRDPACRPTKGLMVYRPDRISCDGSFSFFLTLPTYLPRYRTRYRTVPTYLPVPTYLGTVPSYRYLPSYLGTYLPTVGRYLPVPYLGGYRRVPTVPVPIYLFKPLVEFVSAKPARLACRVHRP